LVSLAHTDDCDMVPFSTQTKNIVRGPTTVLLIFQLTLMLNKNFYFEAFHLYLAYDEQYRTIYYRFNNFNLCLIIAKPRLKFIVPFVFKDY